MRQRHACVIGAGIVGSASAWALARAGWRVTLVDAHPLPGQGASLGNGAQLSHCHVEPLATPAALRALPRWLLSPDSPVRWTPQWRASHLSWLLAFVRACRGPQVQRTTQALLALSFLSRAVLTEALQAVSPGDLARLRHHRPGKLVIYRHASASTRAGVERQLAWQRAQGCEQHLLSADECGRIEPALAATGGGPIAWGVWTPGEGVIDAAALAAWFTQASGAHTRFGTPVSGFEARAGRLAAACLDGGERIEADHFVLAPGVGPGTEALQAALGLRLPIEPIKGYSLSLPILDASAAPTVSITDHARRIVHARLGDRLRVAGFAELCGADTALHARRIDALRDAVRATFPGACRLDAAPGDERPWAGLRPATPHGRPLVGATHWPNLWFNGGHGPLGLTLAAGSAALLASLMEGKAPSIDPAPYRIDA